MWPVELACGPCGEDFANLFTGGKSSAPTGGINSPRHFPSILSSEAQSCEGHLELSAALSPGLCSSWVPVPAVGAVSFLHCPWARHPSLRARPYSVSGLQAACPRLRFSHGGDKRHLGASPGLCWELGLLWFRHLG